MLIAPKDGVCVPYQQGLLDFDDDDFVTGVQRLVPQPKITVPNPIDGRIVHNQTWLKGKQGAEGAMSITSSLSKEAQERVTQLSIGGSLLHSKP